MRIRRAISVTMLLTYVVLAYSGIMLFICPQGRVAYWTGWDLLGLSKEQYSELHSTFMVLFLATGIWHIVLNWKPITAYLKNRSRELKILVPEFYVALGVTGVFLIGTLGGMQPFDLFLSAGESIKDYWERREGSPPWGHAEENSLARFTRGLEDWERLENQRLVRYAVEDAMTVLADAGISVSDSNQQMIDIANDNGTTPQALMEIIQRAGEPLNTVSNAGDQTDMDTQVFPKPMSGLGRLTLREYAERYEADLNLVLSLLGNNGLTVDPDARMREEAERLGTDPEGLIDMLNRLAAQ